MIVLDTHVWWWALSEPHHLSRAATEAIQDTPREQVRVAAISLWELALLFHRQRIVLEIPPQAWFRHALEGTGFQVEPLTPAVALEAYHLPEPFHRDPADRLIVATARILGARLVTKDRLIRDYAHVATIWD